MVTVICENVWLFIHPICPNSFISFICHLGVEESSKKGLCYTVSVDNTTISDICFVQIWAAQQVPLHNL